MLFSSDSELKFYMVLLWFISGCVENGMVVRLVC